MIQIQRQSDGSTKIRAHLDSMPSAPNGYRFLATGETVAGEDLVYDMLMCQWVPAEDILWLMPMVDALGGWASPVPPCRKVAVVTS